MHIPAQETKDSQAGTFDNTYIWLISMAAALGGLLFGYDWVVIGGAKVFYEAYFGLTSSQQIGWANSCALLGCLGGSVVSGGLSDRYGRKKLMLLAAVLFAVSSVLTGWAASFSAFIFWRVIGGVAIGMASNVSPTYIAEVSPPHIRGRLVSLNQMTIVIGILAAQIVNLLIADRVPADIGIDALRRSWNVLYGWRWMFTAVAIPSVIFFVSALFLPESPRWLIVNGRRAAALRIFARIGGALYATEALAVIEDSHSITPSFSTWQHLKQRNVLRALLIGIALAVLQQWSGINVIFNYAEDIYRSAGYGVSGTLFNIVVTGTINLLFTIVALQLVDRLGRRPLLIFGFSGICASHLLLALAYRMQLTGLPILLLTLSAIACYALSLAPITWVIISEIFPNTVRGAGVAAAVTALWTASFILTYTFPLLAEALKPAGTFLLYGCICLAGLVFALRKIPETKGKTLEQIEVELAR
jgi:sugar porter (SP) family MFS transporter